jgi:hypothetical protein
VWAFSVKSLNYNNNYNNNKNEKEKKMNTFIGVVTVFFTLVKNCWTIGFSLPRLIALIAPIIRVIGSEEFKKMLESFQDAVMKAVDQLRQESPDVIPEVPKTMGQRIRIVDRIRRRLALSWLHMTEGEYNAYCNIKHERNDSPVV